MKTTYILLLLLLKVGSLSLSAQVLPESPKARPEPVPLHLQKSDPFVMINSQETAMGAFIVAPEQIATVEVLKEQEAVMRFGDKAKEGAIIIKLKQDVPFARVQAVYDFFQIPQDQQQLKLTINDQLITNKELLLADMQLIEKLELKTQDVTATSRFSFDEDTPYLNIVTVQQ